MVASFQYYHLVARASIALLIVFTIIRLKKYFPIFFENMIKKQLSVAEVLSLITGEEEYPSLSCSSGSEVGQEDVGKIISGDTDNSISHKLPFLLMLSF